MIEQKISMDDWFDLVCKSYKNPPVEHNGSVLPSFPPDEIQNNTTGQCGTATLGPAYVFYKTCIETFSSLGNPISKESRVLDFGVGWGRIVRFFLRDVPLQNIYGVDVMPEFIEICKDTFNSQQFTVCKPFPTTQFPDGHFDYIVGYSVFSHLSEEACLQWMQEFSRILAPSGVLALTTRGRSFFDFCENLDPKLSGYAASLNGMFNSFDDARAKYDRGEFVHSNSYGVSGGDGIINQTFYGETFIPEAYAENAYSGILKLEKFRHESKDVEHPIMFFRKI